MDCAASRICKQGKEQENEYALDSIREKQATVVEIQEVSARSSCAAGALTRVRARLFRGLEHISEAILSMNARDRLVRESNCRYLDGELYSHELSFQQITSIARRLEENAHSQAKSLSMFIFDVITTTEVPFATRWSLACALDIDDRALKRCPTQCTSTEDAGFDAAKLIEAWMQQGYEGCMFRCVVVVVVLPVPLRPQRSRPREDSLWSRTADIAPA
jgi:hypothetical protein